MAKEVPNLSIGINWEVRSVPQKTMARTLFSLERGTKKKQSRSPKVCRCGSCIASKVIKGLFTPSVNGS